MGSCSFCLDANSPFIKLGDETLQTRASRVYMAKTNLFLSKIIELPVGALVSLRIPYLCYKGFKEFLNFVKLLN